jgi:hypothetical protein
MRSVGSRPQGPGRVTSSVVDLDDLRAVHGLRDLIGAGAAAAAAVETAVAATIPAVPTTAAAATGVTTPATRVAAAATWVTAVGEACLALLLLIRLCTHDAVIQLTICKFTYFLIASNTKKAS